MCGIVGIIGSPEAARETFLGLTTLQHRGQDAAGILTHDHEGFHRVKDIGLVESVFTKDRFKTLSGSIAIGHTRYCTIGKGDIVDTQPFIETYPFGIGFVHNGNTVNYEKLLERQKSDSNRHSYSKSDGEILLNLIAEGLLKKQNQQSKDLTFDHICQAVQNVYQHVNGSFSVATLIAGQGLVAFRDSHGIRPLIWGKKSGHLPTGEAHMVASESVALNFNGYEIERSLEPGEILYVTQTGEVHTRVLTKKSKRPCMFEWVYFASPESVIDETPVYRTRIELGKNLAKQVKQIFSEKGIKPDMIVPVPETSRIAAIALSEELKIPYREVLIKNRYIKRTFILASDQKRRKAVEMKLSLVRSELKDKEVVLVDDSIVRGTTSSRLIQHIRKAGVKKIYFVSTCPPIQHPCFYGIDFPNGKELIAYQKNNTEIEKALGADGIIYISIEGLQNAIEACGEGQKVQDPCMACLNGKYPTDVSEGFRFTEKRVKDRLEFQSQTL